MSITNELEEALKDVLDDQDPLDAAKALIRVLTAVRKQCDGVTKRQIYRLVQRHLVDAEWGDTDCVGEE